MIATCATTAADGGGGGGGAAAGAAGVAGTLAVAATGVAVIRWFGPALTAVRFALLAILLLIFFRWVGL